MAEITRLGFTMDQVNILFKTKGQQLKAYDSIFKNAFWKVFVEYLRDIKGFTKKIES